MPAELPTAYLYRCPDTNAHLQVKFSGERRSIVRKCVNQLCFLVINIKGRKVTGLVHDISKEGARIETSCFELPQHFLLDNSMDNERVICKKIWSRGGMTGVQFLDKKFN